MCRVRSGPPDVRHSSDTQATSHATHPRVEHTRYVDNLPYVSHYCSMCRWPDLGSVLLLVYTAFGRHFDLRNIYHGIWSNNGNIEVLPTLISIYLCARISKAWNNRVSWGLQVPCTIFPVSVAAPSFGHHIVIFDIICCGRSTREPQHAFHQRLLWPHPISQPNRTSLGRSSEIFRYHWFGQIGGLSVQWPGCVPEFRSMSSAGKHWMSWSLPSFVSKYMKSAALDM